MDDAAALRGWVTTGSHSTSLLHEYNYLPHPHTVIRPIYTRGQMCKRPVKLCLPDQYTPLRLGSGLCFFLTLSSLLAVEDDKRIRNRSPRNAESQKVVEFYCCGNHQTQSPMDHTTSKSLKLDNKWEVHKRTRQGVSAKLESYIYKVHIVHATTLIDPSQFLTSIFISIMSHIGVEKTFSLTAIKGFAEYWQNILTLYKYFLL